MKHTQQTTRLSVILGLPSVFLLLTSDHRWTSSWENRTSDVRPSPRSLKQPK